MNDHRDRVATVKLPDTPGPMTRAEEAERLGHAVTFLNNHLMRFGNFAPNDGLGFQLSIQDHTPPEVRHALTRALIAAARFVERSFHEGGAP